MRRAAILTCIASGAAILAGVGFDLTTARAQEDAAVFAAIRAFAISAAKFDVPAIEKMVSDDFIYISGQGTFRDRAGFLKFFSARHWLPDEFQQQRIRIYGSVAVVTMSDTNESKGFTNEVRASQIWSKKGGQWIMVSYQETRMPPRK